MRQAFFPRTRRGLVVRLAIVALVVALIIVFEIGVRQVTPDAVQYTAVAQFDGTVISSTSGTITDPATVVRYRAAMTATPSGKYVWQGWHSTCEGVDSSSYTYTFLWHGLPVEVVTQAPFCDGSQYQISSGGITDPGTYYLPTLVQP